MEELFGLGLFMIGLVAFTHSAVWLADAWDEVTDAQKGEEPPGP